MTDPMDDGEPMTAVEWAELQRTWRERLRERMADHKRKTGDCGHGLHQKCKIQGVGFVCLGCDPTWVPVPTADDALWPFSLVVHRPEPMTEADWADTEA